MICRSVRGRSSIDHFFPVDGDYVIKLRLRRAFSNAGIIGYNNKTLDVRLDDEQVKLFSVGGECAGERSRTAMRHSAGCSDQFRVLDSPRRSARCPPDGESW